MQGQDLIAGRLAVRPFEALIVAGISSDVSGARNTARNYLARDRFPFPVRRVGKTLVVLVSDVLAALGIEQLQAAAGQASSGRPAYELELSPADPTPQIKRGRGRPRKNQLLAAAGGAK